MRCGFRQTSMTTCFNFHWLNPGVRVRPSDEIVIPRSRLANQISQHFYYTRLLRGPRSQAQLAWSVVFFFLPLFVSLFNYLYVNNKLITFTWLWYRWHCAVVTNYADLLFIDLNSQTYYNVS